MNYADAVLAINNDLPIRTSLPVHSGKVRSVYWLNKDDSARLIQEKNYDVAAGSELAVMVISDRISAFECIWRGEGGLQGVPGKGAALNAISNFWFEQFKNHGLARSHILDVPHPLVWVVQKAQPVMIEAIARRYITGSMWRSYEKGERVFCGIKLADGLTRDQRLSELLITPSTKGILKGIPDVPEADDVNVARETIRNNYEAFRFKAQSDIDRYETLLKQGFELIDSYLTDIDQIFVDTKFEFGYASDASGQQQLIYMDEVGTPDSSRIWDKAEYDRGRIVENSKEKFRKQLLAHFDDADVLLDKTRMDERLALAASTELPAEVFTEVSQTYTSIAEKITGESLTLPENARAEIMDVLNERFQLIL